MKQKGFVVKITASTLLLTFSYSQILMAADVRQMLLDAKAFFAEEDALRPHGMASSDLEAAQTQQQAAVDQQQMLEDFQNTTFNLTTPNGDILKYVGDKLSEVERPDGTKLANVVTDASGNIQNADLRLSDGSVQIYQNGQVVGYQTPDGSQVLYANGAVTKVINKAGVETLYTYIKDAQGNVTETTLDNAQYLTKYDANKKIKEATRKADNQRIYYTNGIIQKIVNADASQVLFTSAVVGGDTVVTPQGGASDFYVDAQGNKFYFTSGAVSKITLTDNSTVDSITWDTSNKIDNATLTEADGSKYVYQLKKLTRSYDPAGVVTNFTYTTTAITAAKAGNTWEYLADGTAVKYTSLTGDVTTFLQSGAYKGLRDTETLATGQKFIYEYSGSGASIAVQKRELQSTTYNIITYDSSSVSAQASNPGFKTTVQFANDGSIDQSAVITAKYSTTKNFKLNLISGTGSTYTWNAVTTSLGVTLNKGVDYKVELKWESGRIGIYVYAASLAKPTTPTATIADRAWDPTFKAVATNTKMVFDSTSSGYYNRNIDVREKNYGRLPSSPVLIVGFNSSFANYRPLYFKAVQSYSGNIARTLTYWLNPPAAWSFTQSDYNSTTGVTTNTSGSLPQAITSGVDYIGELRIENGKSNLYIYQKGTARPSTPTISLNAFNVSTSLESSFTNATGQGAIYKNLTTPAYSSALAATALTPRVDTIKNSTIIKPAAPSSVNATDFTSITYDSTAALKQVLFKDGSKLLFNQGVLAQAFDVAGKLTSFNFEQSGLSNIVGSSIVQSNLTSTYAANGKLSGIKTGELTIHYKTDGSTVDWIEKTDGTELWDLVFDAAGALTGASIYSPTGEIRTYAAGKLINLRQADQSQFFYANNKVTQMITPEKLTYNFDYTNPSIIQATLAGTPPVDTLTPIKMEYDTNFNLKKVTRQNQEILNYLNTDLVQIDAPSAAPKVFSYTKDAQGKVLSYTVTQGNVLTYYDANNQPTRAVISADASNPNNLDISYQYGKIRQIKKNSVVTFNYAYLFEADGTELTVVEDIEENTTKTYKGGDLVSSLDKATNVLSSYEYLIGKVSKVTVSRFGRLLHTYDYTYSGTNTIVQDEAGVRRTYDVNKKLTFLEKNGEKFGYTYSTQTVTTQNGPPVITETLLPNSLYLTTARSVRPWDGQPAWYSYEQPYGNHYLQTHWADNWVEYTINMSQAGDLKIALEATDSNGLPAGYPNFFLDLSVDGTVKGTMSVPAVGNNAWQAGNLTLTGLSQGSHVIRVKFKNFLNSGGQQTDFKFRNISFKQVVTSATSTTQTVDVASENLIERRLSDGSMAHYLNGTLDHISLPDGTVLSGVTAQPPDSNQPGLVMITRTLPDGSIHEYVNGELTKRTAVDGAVSTYTYQKNAAGVVQTVTVSASGVQMVYSASNQKLQSVQAGTEIFVVTSIVNAQGTLTGYTLTAPSGSYTFAAGNEISFYATYISKQKGVLSSEILVPASTSKIATTYFGTGLDGPALISGTISLTKDMHYTNLTVNAGAVLQANGFKIYATGDFVNQGTVMARGGDGGAGANGSVSGTPSGGAAGMVSYVAGTLRPGAVGATGDIGRTWINSGVQGGGAGVSVSPSLGGSGGTGGSGGGRADGQAGNGPSGGGTATDPLFTLTPNLFNSVQLNAVYGGASGSGGAGGGAQASLGGKGGAGGGSGAGGGLIYISANNFDNSQGVISANGGNGGRGGNGSGVEAGAGGGGAGGGGGAAILISNNIQKGSISVAGGQGGAHGTPSGGTNGSDGNPGQPGSIYFYRNDSSPGQIKISAMVPYWDFALTAIYQTYSATIVEASDSGVVVQNGYAADGALETQKKADGSTTLFQNGKPMSLLDKNGNVLVQYAYDGNGNPTRVYLKNARDALADEISKIRLNIETQRSNTLRDLAQQNNLAYQSIQTQFQDVINTINGAIQSEQARRAGLVIDLQNAGSGSGIYTRAYALGMEINLVDQNISSLQGQLASVYTQQADAYSNLSSQVGTISTQIEVDAVRAMNELAVQQTTLQKEILRQEVAPVVYDFYRRILGRDPGTAEYNSWINQIDYSSGDTSAEVKTTGGVNLTTTISNYLNALPELAERQAYVAAIKQAVTTQINSYLAMTQAQKEVFATTLGLTPQDIVPISSGDVAKILNWINSRSLHFGQSACLALESLLDQKGKVYTRETLARQIILIDILSGVISPLDDGDLVLSVFALNTAAKLYGVTLNGAKLDWEDLKGLYQSSPQARVIAHVNGNHYVIVTAITDTTITYIDPGIGKDKQNESKTLSKADFLKAWKGSVLVEQVLLNQVPNNVQKVLSNDEQKNIRGAFFPLLAAVFAAIFTAVATVVTAVVSAIAALLSTIGAIVANIVGTIGGFLQGLGQALGHLGSSLFAGIKGAISSILGVFPSPIATTAGQTLTSHLTFATFGEAVFKAAITTGFSIATTKGLEALGVNSTIANLAGAFVTGGITGGFKAGFNAQNFIQSGVKGLALQGSQTVMQNAGMDTVLSQTLLTIASPFIDGIQTGTIGGSTVKIIQDLPKTFANYGLSKLGESIGLSPTIAFAAAMPLAQTLSGGFQTGNLTGQNIIQLVQSSLIQGAVTYGVEFAGQTSPILGSLLSQDIARNIELAIGRNGLFGTVFNILQRTVMNVVNVVGGAVQSTFQGISSFAGEIQQKGMAGALESNRDALFNRSTQEAILAKGGVQNVLNTTPKVSITLQNGQSAQELKISGTSSLYFDAAGNLIGKKEDGVTQIGAYYKDPTTGKVALQDGTVYATMQTDLGMTTTVKDGQATSIRIEGPSNQQLVTINPEKTNTPIRIEGPQQGSSSYSFWESTFYIAAYGAWLMFGNGALQGAEVQTTSGSVQPINQIVDIALLNGVRLIEHIEKGQIVLPSTPPDYFKPDNPFTEKLNSFGVQDSFIKALPLFNGFLDFLKAAFMDVVPEIRNYFNEITKNQPGRAFVPVAYSGSGRSTLAALGDATQNGYNVKTIVLVGAPLWQSDTIIESPALERVINIYGTDDDFLLITDVAKFGIRSKFTDSTHPIQTINIELKGINHIEYFYENNANPTPEQRKANDFIARISQASMNVTDLEQALTILGLPFEDQVDAAGNRVRTYRIDPLLVS